MKKILLFCIILLGINASDAQDFWIRKANMPFGRYGAVSFVIDNKAYVGTGDNSYIYDPLKKDFWEYNPAGPTCGGTWTQLADFGGTKRREAVGFSINNKGYIGTGWDGTYTNDFWEYNPGDNSWTRKADYRGGGRSESIGFNIGNKGYIGMGGDGTITHDDFWEYDPSIGDSGTWTPRKEYGGGPRNSATVFTINNKAYVGTGINDVGGFEKDFWEYDPLNEPPLGKWTKKADFGGSARYSASSFSINGKGYLGVGEAQGDFNLKDFWEYDPNTDAWTPRPNYPSAQNGNDGVGFSIGDKGYIGGGKYNNGELWEYSPPLTASYAPDFWEQKASLGTYGGAARWEAVAFSIGNKGYMGTGSDKKDFWQYDPANNTWTQKMDFANGNAGGRSECVGFSIGDKGYVGLGRGPGGDYGYLNDFWEYDTAANLWTQKAYFPGGGRSSAVGFGININNKGYVGTGSGPWSSFNDFYEFVPAPGFLGGTWTVKPNFPGSARNAAEGFSIGTKGYVGGGTTFSNDFWEYDPAKETDPLGPWTPKASMPERHSNSVGFSIGKSGFVGFAGDAYNPYPCGGANDWWEYIPDSNYWVKREFFWGNTTRGEQGAIAFAIGDKGYVGMGYDGNEKDHLWAYLPVLNTITTSTISGSPFCVGNNVTVSYTTIGTAWAGNTFIAQLSDSLGGFASPVNIGTFAATTAGTFSATIPANTLQASGYRIRVVSTNPTRHGSDNGTNIIIKAMPPTADAGPDQTGSSTCELTTVTLAGNSPGTGTGKWSIVSGTGGSFGDDTDSTTTFSGEAGNTYTLKWTISNSPCTQSSDNVVITFNQNPTTANAGPDQTGTSTCGLTTVTLAANTPAPGTGQWSIVSGTGGSFGNANDPQTTFSGVAGNSYTLRWTISNSPCASSSDDVDIKFNPATPVTPGIITGRRYNLCGGGTFTYSIAAVPQATSYVWTVPAGFTLVQNNGTSAQIQIPSSFTTSAQIKVAASNFCGTSAQRSLTVFAVAPNPSGAISGPSTVTAGQQGVIYQLPNAAGVTYTWVVPTGATIASGQGTYKITINFGNNSGYVRVTVSNDCGSTPQGKKFVTVGAGSQLTKDAFTKSYIRAYPNPTESTANVVFNTHKAGSKYEVVVTDVYGKAILRKSGITNIGDNMLLLDISKYANAMYVVKLVLNDEVRTVKLYKVR